VRLKAVVLGFGGTREKLVISALEEATGIQGDFLDENNRLYSHCHHDRPALEEMGICT
jgi:hypothetical protein